jgi:hypothetical protein
LVEGISFSAAGSPAQVNSTFSSHDIAKTIARSHPERSRRVRDALLLAGQQQGLGLAQFGCAPKASALLWRECGPVQPRNSHVRRRNRWSARDC